MEGFKSLLFSALMLAMLASSALSAVPVLGPSYRFSPMSAEVQQLPDEMQPQPNDMANDPEAFSQAVPPQYMGPPDDSMKPTPADAQQFLAELQQQNDMANDPDAFMQQAQLQGIQAGPPGIIGFCYHSLYILAFTSGLKNAGSDDSAYVEMRLKSGETRLVRLYNRPGDDYAKYKGDLWKISLSSFGFNDKCITRSDIDNLALVEGGHDGWNIESVVTFLKRSSYYRLLSRDFNVYRWLDGNGQLSHLRFDLTLV